MKDYGVRVTFQVEYDDGIGPADGLDLNFAEFIRAESAAAAMRKAAAKVEQCVKDRLA